MKSSAKIESVDKETRCFKSTVAKDQSWRRLKTQNNIDAKKKKKDSQYRKYIIQRDECLDFVINWIY